MATRARFSMPADLKLEIGEDGIALEFPGDVELDQDLGVGFDRVFAAGDLTVRVPIASGSLQCKGTLRITGDVDAKYLHGREVILGDGAVRCVAISADHRIQIGSATVIADAIIAPELALHGDAQGRVTVIESLNDPGATKIKGGFSLADYQDMFGDVETFLDQRGLSPLEGGLPAQTPAPAPQPAAPPPEAMIDPMPLDLEEPTGPRVQSPTPAPSPAREEEEDDPLSLSLDILEPLVGATTAAPPAAPAHRADDELYQRLQDALARIHACYQGNDLPPAVRELRSLVDQRDVDVLRSNITDVWNGLLGFHQQRGIRPHHQVTHAFNVIHGLVS